MEKEQRLRELQKELAKIDVDLLNLKDEEDLIKRKIYAKQKRRIELLSKQEYEKTAPF